MNLANCRIDEAKITHYLLNDSHKDGGSKSRFFKSFGFTEIEWRVFYDALIVHPNHHPMRKIIPTEYGIKFEVVCSIDTPDGRNPCIITVWQVRGGVGDPVLVTAYPS